MQKDNMLELLITITLIILIYLVIQNYTISKNVNDLTIKYVKQLQEKNYILNDELQTYEYGLATDESSILYANNQIKNLIIKLDEVISKESVDTEDIRKITSLISEATNNIDVIIDDVRENKIGGFNIKENLECLFNEFKDDKKFKINYDIPDELNNIFNYDNLRLISALRLVILKSIEKGSKSLNFKITTDFNKESLLINFIIGNIRFVDKKNIVSIEWIKELFNLKVLDPKIIDTRIEPEFLIIRQNLNYITQKIELEDEKNTIKFTLEVYNKNINNSR